MKTVTASPADRGRLREILGVLRRHGVLRGLSPEKLRAVVEELGPTFIKLGQLLSLRRDMLPAAYCAELAKLQVNVSALDFSDIQEVIEREYHALLGDIFLSFSKEPLGSASIAQVHTAILKDGQKVAVKVQRPGIHETMARDIALLRRVAKLLKLTEFGETVNLNMILDELWTVTQQEMDFLTEARNMEEFHALNCNIRFFDCPQAIRRLSTGHVLVMDYITGFPIDDRPALETEGYSLKEIGLKLADSYIKQVLEDGFFHADPHPGNLRICDGKIVWLDMGMMGRLSDRDRHLLRSAMRAIVTDDTEVLTTIILKLCNQIGTVNREALSGELDVFLARYADMQVGRMELGQIFGEIMDIARRHGLTMPPGIFLLGRGLTSLQGLLTTISPDIDLLQILTDRMGHSILRDVDWKSEIENSTRTLLLSGHKIVDLPGLLHEVLRQAGRGQSRINVKITGAENAFFSLGQMLHRFIQALLSVALFVGGCLLCGTDIGPIFFTIPLPALLSFAAALLLGIFALKRGEAKKK